MMQLLYNKFRKEKRCLAPFYVWLMVSLVFVPSADASTAAGEVKKANALYDKARFNDALEHYQKALNKDQKSTQVEYDLGTALYKENNYVDSIEHLRKALLTDEPKLQDSVQYNLGNAFYKLGVGQEKSNLKDAIFNLEKSIAHYGKVLARSQKDLDAQNNDAFVKKELERLKQKQQEQKSQQNQQNKDNKDSKDQDQKKDPSGEDKKDQRSPSDENQSGQKEDQKKGSQKENSGDQNDQNQKGQGQNDQNKKSDQDKNDQPSQQPKPADGDRSGKPQENDSEGGTQANGQGMMTPKEAQMFLDDYQRNDEPKGMLYFKPEAGKDKPVEKDW